MVRTEITVQLTEELRRLLDAEAARRGISGSALIREAIASHLREAGEAAVTAKIVEGYRRIPPTTPDGWGDLEAAGDHATRELFQRFDAEERAAGEGGGSKGRDLVVGTRRRTEVPIDEDDGMPEPCALSLGNISAIRKALCTERITRPRQTPPSTRLRTATVC